LCFLGVFATALVLSLDYPQLDALGPGPGFFPFWLSLIGIALACALLLQVTLRSQFAAAATVEWPSWRAAAKTVAVLVAMAAAVALLEPLGFRLTMLPFIAVLLPILGARSWPAIALTALAGSFGVFHVFNAWLKVPLPIGTLGF
jgi:putative tricarboxylic transport membrane protein